MLASSLAFIDVSVTNVALAAIGKSFGGSAADLQWTINAYRLTLSALLLLGGAAGDHFARRRMLIAGVALFAVASLLCAAAPGLLVQLASRGLQGIGAAMLMPNSLAILGDAFSGEAWSRSLRLADISRRRARCRIKADRGMTPCPAGEKRYSCPACCGRVSDWITPLRPSIASRNMPSSWCTV